MHEELLKLVKSRKRAGAFGYGIGLASWAFRQAAECGGDRDCLKAVLRGHLKSFSIDNAVKEAGRKLTFCNPAFTEVKLASSVGSFRDLLPDGVEPPPHTLMLVRHVLTTPREDRDKDVLQTRGAMVDPILPFLWQHIHTLPIGRNVATIEHSENVLKNVSAIVDVNELAHDAAILFEAGVLRFSHGFRALEFRQRKVEGDSDPGFEVTKFEIMEQSAVSVPSNVDAQVEAYSKGKLKSELVKRVSQEMWRSRPATSPGADLETTTTSRSVSLEATTPSEEKTHAGACACGEKRGAGGPSSITKVGEPRSVAQPPSYTECDVKRWAKSHGVAFEVDKEHVEASTLEYDWVAKHLRCQVKHILKNSEFIPSAKMPSFLTALNEMTQDLQLVDTRNLTHDSKAQAREEPPVYEVLQLNSTKSNTFLVKGIKFLLNKAPGGTDYAIKFTAGWSGITITVYTTEERREDNAKLFDKCWDWFRHHNFLKGEAFAISGDFLPRDDESFDDVFLEARNIAPIKAAVESLNRKGAESPKRGMLFMGPPGTGKTLSGRILKNQANATFIWISARDFYYMGAFGGLSYGFDMAKLLAPSVLFIEDVDNWLGRHEVDFLKTEMDGIAKTKGVTTILTTNFPEQLPEALIDRPGRFHDVLKFDLPTPAIRAEMLRKWLPDLDDAARELAVKESEGWSGAHLYHLAEFAKSLHVDDETISGAVTKAVEKIREQRQLIDDVQMSGSRYVHHREVSEWRPKAAVVNLTKRVPIQMTNEQISDDLEAAKKKLDGEKAGRRMSKANESHLREAVDDIGEAMKMDIPRGCKSLCKSAADHVGAVLKSIPEDKPEEDDSEDAGPAEEQVEEAKNPEPVMLNTPKKAVQLLIEHGTHEDRVRAVKQLSAVIAAEEAHRHADEVLAVLK